MVSQLYLIYLTLFMPNIKQHVPYLATTFYVLLHLYGTYTMSNLILTSDSVLWFQVRNKLEKSE